MSEWMYYWMIEWMNYWMNYWMSEWMRWIRSPESEQDTDYSVNE